MPSTHRPEQTLKRLITQRGELEAEIESLNQRRSIIDHDINRRKSDLRNIHDQIASLKALEKGIVVSEHAILRYLERVCGIDMEKIKQEILPESTQRMVMTLGNGTYPASSHKVKIKDGVAITVIPKEEVA